MNFELIDALDQKRVLTLPGYIRQFHAHYKEYARLRATKGMYRTIALRRAFGEAFNGPDAETMCYLVESTDLYADAYRHFLTKTPMSEMWNDRISVQRLLEMANNPFDRSGASTMKAIQELNVLIGITIVDENGKTRKGGSMADFYRSVGAQEDQETKGEAQEGQE